MAARFQNYNVRCSFNRTGLIRFKLDRFESKLANAQRVLLPKISSSDARRCCGTCRQSRGRIFCFLENISVFNRLVCFSDLNVIEGYWAESTAAVYEEDGQFGNV